MADHSVRLTLYFFLFSISSLRLASHRLISVSTFFSRSSRSCHSERKVVGHLELVMVRGKRMKYYTHTR